MSEQPPPRDDGRFAPSRASRRRRLAAPAIAAAGLVAALAGVATHARPSLASDHQDSPNVELNPSQDMTDVYAFPGSTPDRIVLVLNSWAFLTPAETPTTTFDPNLLYQFKIDNTGDAKEDRVIQVTFTGTGADQQVEVRGPLAPPVQGAMGNKVASDAAVVTGALNQTLGSPTGMQVFAGAREDPFFIDLEAFFRIIPDRKPVTGPLAQLPDAQSATSFRAVGQAVDAVRGKNVLSIVIELPKADLVAGGDAKIGIWGTISR
jgi:hypothetical protein